MEFAIIQTTKHQQGLVVMHRLFEDNSHSILEKHHCCVIHHEKQVDAMHIPT